MPFRVERVHVRRANRLHRRHPREQIALIRFRFLHVAHADETTRHQFALLDCLLRFRDEPGEVLERADFERDRVRLLELHPRRPCAQHLAPIIGHADERARVALRDQPFEVGQIRRFHLRAGAHQVRQRARLLRLAIDLVNRPVLGDHLQHVVDQLALGIEQQRVDRREVAAEFSIVCAVCRSLFLQCHCGGAHQLRRRRFSNSLVGDCFRKSLAMQVKASSPTRRTHRP